MKIMEELDKAYQKGVEMREKTIREYSEKFAKEHNISFEDAYGIFKNNPSVIFFSL